MDRRPPFPTDFQLILASQSPRRHSLLQDMGVPFQVVTSHADEALDGGDAVSIAEANALAKLRGAVLPDGIIGGAFVLATDTVVAVGGRVMGKAADEDEATSMLVALSGRTHQVVSGVALARVVPRPGISEGAQGDDRFLDSHVESAVTDVTFRNLDAADIEAYVASGEWRGKAGAYAIQGLAAMFAEGLAGEYSNVVGLPLGLVYRMFRDQGFDLVRRTWL